MSTGRTDLSQSVDYRCAALLLLVAGAILLWTQPMAAAAPHTAWHQINTAEDSVTRFIGGLGLWAFVVAPLLMVVVAILPIPAEIPAMVNGVIFGPVVGTVVTWSGALIGATISFELARRFGRPVAQRVLKRDTIDRVDVIVHSAGWPVLLLLRLVPTVAFTAVNWGAGLTALRRGTFWWTTAVGILPGALLFTVSGTGLAALYRVNPAASIALIVAGLSAIGWTFVRFRRSVHERGVATADRSL